MCAKLSKKAYEIHVRVTFELLNVLWQILPCSKFKFC